MVNLVASLLSFGVLRNEKTTNKYLHYNTNTNIMNTTKQSTATTTASSQQLAVLGKTKKVLVLDLDETLVHATSKPMRNVRYDVVVEVVIDRIPCRFYVKKRPHVDLFLKQVCQWFDVVIFTASLRQYADPVIDHLDPKRLLRKRMFRESCVNRAGVYIKDLTQVHSDLSKIAIIDNSPVAYSMQKENAIPITDWFGDNLQDEALLQLLPFLQALQFTADVRSILSLRRG
jgi:Dullard-like phosphatase family protein